MTGTVEDQFTPIYMAMAQRSVLHGQVTPPDVDRMDLVTIWALMGIEHERRRFRDARNAYQAPEPAQPLRPLTADEKAERLARLKASGGGRGRAGTPSPARAG